MVPAFRVDVLHICENSRPWHALSYDAPLLHRALLSIRRMAMLALHGVIRIYVGIITVFAIESHIEHDLVGSRFRFLSLSLSLSLYLSFLSVSSCHSS